MNTLRPLLNLTGKPPEISFDYSLESWGLMVNFSVKSQTHFLTSTSFKQEGHRNWGLWQKDVVEIFVTRNKKRTPYLEVVLSPLGQVFLLVIESPREKFDYPKEAKGFKYLPKLRVNHWGEHCWEGQVALDFSLIPGSEKLHLNLHAILGIDESRNYYAAYGHNDGVLDFHRPQFFKEIKD